MKLGNQNVVKGQPVFYLDTAKTSTIEGAATTVYAKGGRGNTRLIAWEGEKTLTFTVEDALLSPISFAMLSGAGLVKGNSNEEVHFHQTSNLIASSTDGSIDLSNALEPDETVDIDAPLFILEVDESGDLTGKMIDGYYTLDNTQTKLVLKDTSEQYIETIDQPKDNNTSNWDNVIQTATDTSNEGQDWRYAQPLTSTQIESNDGKQYSVTGFGTNGVGVIVNASEPTKKIPFEKVIKGVPELDALYLISKDLKVLPYNLSHLTFASNNPADVVLADEKVNSSDNYYPIGTVFAMTDSGEPILSENANKYLTDVETINSYLGTKEQIETAITLFVNYLVNGKDSLAVENDATATTQNQTIVKAFITIQAALQYYTYSYIKKYTKITTDNTHEHTYSALNTAKKFLGFTSSAVFTPLNSTTAKAYSYDSVNKTYDEITDARKSAYYQGRGRAVYEMLKKGATNSKALKETAGKAVMVDYYVVKPADTVSELQIDAGSFAGYYYVEADTLFRRQVDGVDLPANITFPNVKIQSNFTFSMAPTGDPSTFTFTMDAMPGYTYFDKTKKVLCAIQIVDDKSKKAKESKSIFTHPAGFGQIDVSVKDSIPDRNSE